MEMTIQLDYNMKQTFSFCCSSFIDRAGGILKMLKFWTGYEPATVDGQRVLFIEKLYWSNICVDFFLSHSYPY